ncbi:MAG TPA: gliding motility-associated C-terminal domain-containing protein [Chryseolinea sp.]|nr:gliding motility-associated C-terminal domain-containing protein [Chryseolinea sp.]
MLIPKWHNKTLCFFCLVFLSALSQVSSASHLIDVEIRAKPLNCNSRTYEITVIAYVKIGGVAFGGEDAFVAFGDGDSVLVPELAQTELVDAILNIGKVEFTVIHTYETFGVYILSYFERNRNEGIVNMDASVNTPFYTESSVTISEKACDSSPYLTVPPIDRACSGTAYYHNPGAVDPDDDSVSFSFVIPKQNKIENVMNFHYPNDSKFYTGSGLNYNQGNESGTGPPTFVIDPIDGTVTWDAPGATGEYALAIKITAWKFNPRDSAWVESGYSIRDMQVVVEDCSNKKPDLTVPDEICALAGTPIEFAVTASDPDGDPVFIEAFSDVFSVSDNPATVNPTGSPLQSTAAPYDTAALQFKWNVSCLHVKNQPYKVVFKVTDSPPSGPRLVRFKTVSIRVIAPPPELENVTINPVAKKVTLGWKSYPCENVSGFQVWRRVAQYKYEQPECNVGMPHFLRYTLLTTLPGDVQNYTDSDLAIAAQYCYRIVALIGENNIPSRISLDTCFIPKPAEAPVITNVSILETSESSGKVEVRWTSPFDIDQNQYPPPYEYKVYRSTGFGQNDFIEVTSSPIRDTVLIDTQNTAHFAHEYRIILFVPTLTNLPIDTSSVASSVFLTAQAQPGKIKLSWEAQTPWSNYLQAYPYHRIYRSNNNSAGPFILIDSVDVNENGFQYIDNGRFQGQALQENQLYYYKILTRGSYGNPELIEPLENYSEISNGTILDSKPPCTPIVAIDKVDCSAFNCTTDSYYNKLTWHYPDDLACSEDHVTYQVFVSDTDSGDLIPLATTSETSFQDSNLSSLAKCYVVTAIDAVGNISPVSEPVCNDNCPYFELPNVFTPSPDGLNDQFIAFGSETGPVHCARFVLQVDLKVYNRWGMEVYSINDVIPEDNYIFWNGSTNSGKELEAGVYFYSAEVTFDVRDPAQQHKVINGWVHLIRGN